MKNNNQKLIEALKTVIASSDQMWDTKTQSHAYIIGYLQGHIKATITELEIQDELSKYASKTN